MITIKQLKESKQFFLIAGPCVVEDEGSPYIIAYELKKITHEFRIPFIFKASYRKANRTHYDSFTGIGDINALKIIQNIGKELNISTTTDIHSTYEARSVAQYVDILQIPAFLCRQTDILIAAAETGRIINIKKGQFADISTMMGAIEKIEKNGNKKIMITERGKMFGSNDLVVDFREVELLKSPSYPIVLDVTHSIGICNVPSSVLCTSALAKAGIAIGVNGIFMETHPNPSEAKSDGDKMFPLDRVKDLLTKLSRIRLATL